MIDPNDPIERMTETLREPVQIDRDLNRRVMAQIEKMPAPGQGVLGWGVLEWMRRRRTISVSPLGGLAFAAGVAAALLVGSRVIGPTDSTSGGYDTGTVIQFVLVAPAADSVHVVGDFNDWELSATPLVRDAGAGVWSVTVPLEPGRYRYSFVIDGTTWLQDPNAAPAVGDEFGRPNSVVTVGGL